MKIIIINKLGQEWKFNTVKDARPHIKKGADYEIKIYGGEKVRVYDDREVELED